MYVGTVIHDSPKRTLAIVPPADRLKAHFAAVRRDSRAAVAHFSIHQTEDRLCRNRYRLSPRLDLALDLMAPGSDLGQRLLPAVGGAVGSELDREILRKVDDILDGLDDEISFIRRDLDQLRSLGCRRRRSRNPGDGRRRHTGRRDRLAELDQHLGSQGRPTP